MVILSPYVETGHGQFLPSPFKHTERNHAHISFDAKQLKLLIEFTLGVHLIFEFYIKRRENLI
jgi:hypothetical protein